jgi:hypothetical protein
MTGIVIFTAGREDAYKDYVESVKEGHDPEVFKSYLTEEEVAAVTESDTGKVHLWGTSVASKWRSVEPGDVAFVYRDGRYIAQATVIRTRDDLELAEELWRRERNPWDTENPWRYLTFLTAVEEIDVPVESFNELVGYEAEYIPQGFSRVADTRIRQVEESYESVETAVNELTGTGVRVHELDGEIEEGGSDCEGEDESEVGLGDRLVAASRDGERYGELEELVAKAFSRLGFDARWIEGGDDTDVEITAPIRAVVEVKARSSGTVQSPDATRIQGHADRHNADHAIVVGPGFSPAAMEDADRQGMLLLGARELRALLQRRGTYGMPPELLTEYLTEPGVFQDDRIDQLDEVLRGRVSGMSDLLAVVEALERASPSEGTAESLRLILKGKYQDEQVPSLEVIEQSLHLLAHPSVQLADYSDGQYQSTTTAANAKVVLQRFGNLIGEVDAVPDEE